MWVVPGAILGAITPLLENPSQRTTPWTSVATVVGFALAAFTLGTHQVQRISSLQAQIAAGIILRRHDNLEVLCPVLAIAISLTISSLTFVPLHLEATFHQELINVVHIDSLPANMAEDPSGILGDFYLVPHEVDNGSGDFVATFHGFREKWIAEQNAILTEKRAELRRGRNANLDFLPAPRSST